jgi:hypothetical protein
MEEMEPRVRDTATWVRMSENASLIIVTQRRPITNQRYWVLPIQSTKPTTNSELLLLIFVQNMRLQSFHPLGLAIHRGFAGHAPHSSGHHWLLTQEFVGISDWQPIFNRLRQVRTSRGHDFRRARLWLTSHHAPTTRTVLPQVCSGSVWCRRRNHGGLNQLSV